VWGGISFNALIAIRIKIFSIGCQPEMRCIGEISTDDEFLKTWIENQNEALSFRIRIVLNYFL
jgi:hypothetical protein